MTSQVHDDVIRLANEIGGNTEYCRAGGGNVPCKEDEVLYIKPSGVSMASLSHEDLVPLKIDVLLNALHSDDPVEGDPVQVAARAAQIGKLDRRPSVEILFHALIDDPLVLHLHPLTINALTCNQYGFRLAQEILGDRAVWVSYEDPGVPLARRIEQARQEFVDQSGKSAPKITLLGNHGLIVSGETYEDVSASIDEATRLVREAIDASASVSQYSHEAILGEEEHAWLMEAFKRVVGAEHISATWTGIARGASSLESAPVSRGPLIPDQIVYSGSFPLIIPLDSVTSVDGPEAAGRVVERAAEEFRAQHSREPIVAVVPNEGVMGIGENSSGADNAVATFVDALRVSRDADQIGKTRVMDDRERSFIENWEAESYRRSVARKAANG